jgi:predicted secreted hydrolase
MSGDFKLSRRAFAGGAMFFSLAQKAASAQGFAGLGMSGDGFADVVPDKKLVFPDDHGPHPDFRIEWWYVTANLADATGVAYGAQWTLFRQAMHGWDTQRSPAPIPIASAKLSHAAALDKRALRPRPLMPGSMPGKCGGARG